MRVNLRKNIWILTIIAILSIGLGFGQACRPTTSKPNSQSNDPLNPLSGSGKELSTTGPSANGEIYHGINIEGLEKIYVGEIVEFVIKGGTPPFQVKVSKGAGEIEEVNERTFKFLAPDKPGVSLVSVQDSIGQQDNHKFIIRDSVAINSYDKGAVACYINEEEKLYCVGASQFSLGDGHTMTSSVPVEVKELGEDIIEVTGGKNFNCLLTEKGKVYCFGFNIYGNLGVGSDYHTGVHHASVPMMVKNLPEPIKQISSSNSASTCALGVSGQLYCWGLNNKGVLGIDRNSPYKTLPTPVVGLEEPVMLVRMGYLTACAITENYELYCWGHNAYYSKINTGLKQGDYFSPQKVNLGNMKVRDVSLRVGYGGEHYCVLTIEGEVYCWGRNDFGQTSGDISQVSCYPYCSTGKIKVELGEPARKIKVGKEHSCALLNSGTVKCWGSNRSGQLGAEKTKLTATSDPIKLPLTVRATNLDVFWKTTCVHLESHKISCFGSFKVN